MEMPSVAKTSWGHIRYIQKAAAETLSGYPS